MNPWARLVGLIGDAMTGVGYVEAWARWTGVKIFEVYSYGVTTATAGIASAVSLVLLSPALLQGTRRFLIQVFERDTLAQTVRIVSLFLFVAGFHFDMLAS
ncbi:hypothetical protein AB0C10_08895 [Microbispora amethystogenes]|uniref:hypothetical protein n=1 Tax=Microbispora amethystogenes TaxID=1427754 RepID=UPI0033CCB3EC